MQSRKIKQNTLSKFLDRKISLEEIPSKTVKLTFHALRWIFLLIFLFITIGIFVLFITGGQSYIQTILGYSITGFFTFFMGYFGWLLAQSIIEMLTGKEEDKTTKGYSYYVKKNNRSRYRS